MHLLHGKLSDCFVNLNAYNLHHDNCNFPYIFVKGIYPSIRVIEDDNVGIDYNTKPKQGKANSGSP